MPPTILTIGTAEDLFDFARSVNGQRNLRAKYLAALVNDIDLEGARWTPIGTEDAPFRGKFDGAGHTISGLYLEKKDGVCCGLFGACKGTVENLSTSGTITCVAADTHSAVGGIAGLVTGGTIINCSVDLAIESKRLSLGMFAGGVAGYVRDGIIKDCRSSARFEDVLGHFLYLGGVVGAAKNADLFRCVFDGCIRILGGIGYYVDAGGIVGNVQGRTLVERCLNRGVVDAYSYDFEFAYVGGIAGNIDGDGSIRKSVNRGKVLGGSRGVGGIAGRVSSERKSTPFAAVDGCMNLGDVIQSPNSPGGSCGGIVAEVQSSHDGPSVIVRNCASFGNLVLQDPAGKVHPIAASCEGGVLENNFCDQRLISR